MHYTKEQIRLARIANLHKYLLQCHRELFKIEGHSIRPKDNPSISIKEGYSGFTDFSTNETGNSVDYLTKYLGYSTPEAVYALIGASAHTPINHKDITPSLPNVNTDNAPLNLPEPLHGQYRQLFAYLMHRAIPAITIQQLIDQHLIYQEATHNNIVFLNKEKDFAEIHGTISYSKSFHSCRKKSPDRFWWFRTSQDADVAYICEAAIDAISLYELHQKNNHNQNAYYISIAGVSNQSAIDRIKHQNFLNEIILAVDNDAAGNKCRENNKDLKYILPQNKDWNEDLLYYASNNF